MKSLLEYVLTEMKRHFRTEHHYIKIFGKRRDISRVITILKVVGEAIGTASTISFLLELLE